MRTMNRYALQVGETRRRKFLVIIDQTEECQCAVYYAARRAHKTSGDIVMLAFSNDQEAQTQWLNIGAVMREENREAAKASLEKWADYLREKFAIEPQTLIREGDPINAIKALLREDQSIAILVLASSPMIAEGHPPGYLTSNLSSLLACDSAVPITVVPGNLKEEEIDGIA